MRAQPTFRLRDFGESASLSVEFDSRVPLFISDVQHLIMYSQIGHHSPYTPARWCQLDKYTRVIHTNVLIIENISAYNFISNESLFPFLSSNYTHKLEIVNSSAYKTDLVQDLLMVPLTSKYCLQISYSIYSSFCKSAIVTDNSMLLKCSLN